MIMFQYTSFLLFFAFLDFHAFHAFCESPLDVHRNHEKHFCKNFKETSCNIEMLKILLLLLYNLRDECTNGGTH